MFVSGTKCISQIQQNTYTLSLLATGGNVEVFTYDLRVDKPCSICPGDKPGLMEFYYVLEGNAILKLDGGDTMLGPGEHFYVYNLKSNISFTTSNGAKLLCVTSQPSFNALREFHESLCKLLEGAEAKDLYTYNHGSRVQMYSLKIGELMGIPHSNIFTLQVASLFHDIGKYHVPDSILNKPGRLTDEEFDCIRKHPEHGVNLLKGRFEEPILTAVAQHHERLDGSGYPAGLKAGQIVPEARIIAVADAFDAMTTDRAYRSAKKASEAMEELENLSTQYDGDMVQALRCHLKNTGEI